MCLPGGEALQAAMTGPALAAEEGASGKWLQELESGRPLRALAPGMDQGAFGAWATPEDEPGEAGSRHPASATFTLHTGSSLMPPA
jgi:hypothetical protein